MSQNIRGFPLPFGSKRVPFAVQVPSKNISVDEKSDFNNMHTYYQPTCYGNFGTAFFKEINYGPVNGGMRARADCTHQMYKRQ